MGIVAPADPSPGCRAIAPPSLPATSPIFATAGPAYSEAGVTVRVAGSKTAPTQGPPALSILLKLFSSSAGRRARVPVAREATEFRPAVRPRSTGCSSSRPARESSVTACACQPLTGVNSKSPSSSGSASVCRTVQPLAITKGFSPML